MAKKKFYYDEEKLIYVQVLSNRKDKINNVLIYIFVVICLPFFGFFILSFLIKSPKIRQQEDIIKSLKINYEILSTKVKKVNEVLDEIEERDDNIYRVYFRANPVAKSVRNQKVGGINRYKDLEGHKYSELIKDLAQKVDLISQRLVVQSKSLDTIVEMAKNKTKRLAHIPAIQPVSNKNLKRMASGYGYRIHPIYKVRKFHSGMDFSTPEGTPIVATGDGTVTVSKDSRMGYGKHIEINHGYGYITRYAHLSRRIVRRWKKVKRGDIIGYVGSTGSSTAPHLHYEVLVNKKHTNPVYFYYNDLTPEQYEKMIRLSRLENQSFD